MARRKVQDKEAVEQTTVEAEGAGGEGRRAEYAGAEPEVKQDVVAATGAVLAHLDETLPQALQTEYATPRVIRLPNGITIYHH